MISSVRGNLIYVDPNYCIVECSGVGLKCFITSKTLGMLPQRDEEVKLYTYMSVKEDSIDLFGFYEMNEMECFKLITSVSGVGPKIGIALLSALSAEQIYNSISTNNPKTLTVASGVGLKLAQRIVLELKDKVSAVEGAFDNGNELIGNLSSNSSSSEAISALVSLGYSRSEASLAVGKLPSDLKTEEIIKEALKLLSRQV